MHLPVGTRLGDYEIVESLGRGGMGEVYRAHDARLKRDVAVKIVHPELADEELLARFRREAHVLASLCHPHIAGVHEFDEADGVTFIVMELVAGQTLAERLASGPIALDEALRIASQVAAALEAVHEKGVVHRDLKPSNVKIANDGLVKVLDFGLARAGPASPAAGSAAATATIDATRIGAVLGTAAYMSPEQARGWEIDRRTDIWAFGCVLFEMLAGRPAFTGASLADTTAAVIGGRPNWSALPATTPPLVLRLLRRCLEPDTKRRLRDIGDARLEIEEAIHGTPEAPALPAPPSTARRVTSVAVFLVGALVGGLAGWGWWKPSATPATPARFTVPLPANTQLTGLDLPGVALAPDGSRFVFVARRGDRPQLFVRALADLDATPIPDTFNAAAPFFSPDGRWIAFFADGTLKKVDVTGGSPVKLCDAPVGLGGSWGTDGTIVFASATGSGLSRVSADGGQPQPITMLDVKRGEFSHRWPEWIAGTGTVIYTVGTVGSWNDAEIVAQSLETGERTVLVRGGTSPRYLPSGQLLYAQGGRIMRVPFDAARREIAGAAEVAIENVLQTPDGAAQLAVSHAGQAVYIAGSDDAGRHRLVVVDRDGTTTPLAGDAGAFAYPRVSPDGRQVVLLVDHPSPDLWSYDLALGTLTQLTFDARASAPAWTPDGRRVTYGSVAGGASTLLTTEVPPSGPAERLARSPRVQIPGSWSPHGLLAYVERRPETGRDIQLWDSRNGTVRPLLASPADESAPRFSPDGRWLAYVSNASGRHEIRVVASSGDGAAISVSVNGGSEPVWARDGRELYFRDGDKMMAVVITLAGVVRAGPPQLLFEGQFTRGTLDAASYDVMPDGRFLLLQRRDATPTVLHVLLNWSGGGAAPSGR